MSTNFYYQVTDGPLALFESLHIGKRSAGWEFSFQAFDEIPGEVTYSNRASVLEMKVKVPALRIRSVKDWKSFMAKNPGEIQDEYGTVYSAKEFWDIVEGLAPGNTWAQTGKPLLNHFDELVRNVDRYGPVDPKQDWKDAQGFSFSMGCY